MVDLFEKEGIAPPKDIFAVEGITPPSIGDRNAAALSPPPLSEAPPEVQQEVQSHVDQNMQLAKARFTDEQIDEIKKKGKIGFIEAQDFIGWEDVVPLGSIYQAKELYDINSIANKMEKGDELTQPEQDVFNKFIDQHVEMNLRGLSVGGGISYYGSQMPAFMTEFALSGGVGKVAQEGTEQAVKQVVKQAVVKKVAAKTAGVAANVAARTAAITAARVGAGTVTDVVQGVEIAPQKYIPSYAERRLNDYMAVTDKGAILFQESKESPATSALKGMTYYGIEIASEMSGAAIGKYLVKPITGAVGGAAAKYLKTPIATGVLKLPVAARQNLYAAYKAINPNARVSQVFTKAGWNGMLAELGEERVADVMRATFDLSTDKEYGFKDYMDAITPSADQLMIEAGIVSIAGGVRSSADIALNVMTEKLGDRAAAKEAVDNLSATEQEALIERELTKRAPFSEDIPFEPIGQNAAPAASATLATPTPDRIEASMVEAARIKEQLTRSASININIPASIKKSLGYTPVTLSQFIKNAGGIREYSGELKARGIDHKSLVGLVRKEKESGGATLIPMADSTNEFQADYVVQKAFEAGYFPDKRSIEELTHSDLYDAIAEDLAGKKRYSESDMERIAMLEQESSLIDEYDRAGITENMTVEEIAAILRGEDITMFDKVASDPVSKAQGQAAAKENPPAINNEESGFNRFYRDFVNTLQPIEDITKEAQARGADIAAGQNPFTLSRTYAGVIGQIEHNLKYGTTRLNPETGQFEVTGKSMKHIMDDFDNSVAHIEGSRNAREIDLNDYLIARRTLEDLVPREDVKVSDADKLKSVEAMTRLAEKYKEEFAWFDTFAREIYEYQRRVLSNLVDSGIMSKEMYDGILAKNPNYIPFQRVLEEEGLDSPLGGNASLRQDTATMLTRTGKFTGAKASKVIKKIKGSDKEIKTVTHSVIANTAKIIDLAYRNRVATGIANLADVMPEYIQPMAQTKVKRGTAKVKVTYDAGLRRKLEAAIEHFGNSLSRQDSIKAEGLKGHIRGSYSPMEKMVRARIGTNEGTLAHEVGHMLDYEIGLMEKLMFDPKVKKELQELGKRRMSGETVMTEQGEKIVFEDRVLDVSPKDYQEYVTSDREVIANMFDAYVNAPDLLESIAPNAKKRFDALLDAKPELAFIKEIKPTVERADELIERDVWSPLDTAPQGTITVFIDGKKKYFKVSAPLLDAMNNLSPVQMNATMRVLTSPLRFSASVLRAGATLIPEFWVRNVIRDQSTALLQSPIRPTPIDMVKGLAAVISKNDIYQDWMKNGGSFNSYMELDDRGLEKAYNELFRPQGRFARYAKNPINILADISGGLEQATRLGVYAKAKRQGIVGMEAALLAREATLDFGRGGAISRGVNRYIPFFNAGVQSVDKLARTFKENPKATMFWGMATITMPSVLITGYYLYGAPDDERREYLEIPQWQRDMFWVFKEDGQWRRIPKPFSFGYLFGSVPERFMIWAYQGDKPEVRDFWKELSIGVAGTLSPVYDPSAIFPPLIKVAIEDLTNYNFFTGRDIYPEWMERLDPEQRKTKYTSEAAVLLGEQLGVSPALLDHSIRGQLAGSANYVTDAADTVIKQVREWNGATIPSEPKTPADTMIIKAFSVREPTGYGANSTNNFFDTWEKVSEAHATLGHLEGEEKIKYREKNADILRAYEPMKGFYNHIRAAGKHADRVYSDETMSADEKVKALSENGKVILDAAIAGNKWYKDNVKGN